MLLSTTINAIWLISWFQPQKKEFLKKSYIQTILSLFGFLDLYEKKNHSFHFPINERLSFESIILAKISILEAGTLISQRVLASWYSRWDVSIYINKSQRNIEVHRKKPTTGNLFHEYITRLNRGIRRVQQHKWGLVKRIKKQQSTSETTEKTQVLWSTIMGWPKQISSLHCSCSHETKDRPASNRVHVTQGGDSTWAFLGRFAA